MSIAGIKDPNTQESIRQVALDLEEAQREIVSIKVLIRNSDISSQIEAIQKRLTELESGP